MIPKNLSTSARLRAICAWLALAAAGPLRANVTLASLASTHAVLQRSAATRVWGRADPGEPVRVTLGAAHAETRAGSDGRWQVTLDLLKGEAGPFDLTVEGKNKLTVGDVVVGEEWLCSGQSNMEWTVRGDSKEMMAVLNSKITNPLLRQFKVVIEHADAPRDDCQGAWTLATPQDIAAFTGVGYFFGKKIQSELQVPIGLINSTAPGTPIEQFMSVEAFEKLPELNTDRLKRLDVLRGYPDKRKAFVDAYDAWTTKYNRQDRPADPAPFADPNASTADWTPLAIPGKAATPGALWVRHALDAPPVAAGKQAFVVLGGVHDYVSIYWNGEQIAHTDPAHPPAVGIYKFPIPGNLIKAGTNVMALRLVCAEDAPGLYEGGVILGLGGLGAPLPWQGDWSSKMEGTLPAATDEERRALPKAPFPPSISMGADIYNAMIAPLVPATIRGIVWYQGEANVPRAQEYKGCFQTMIEDYRHKWGSELPFYFCQLPNYKPFPNEYGQGMWPELRESQAAALALPKTGQAVLIDVGEESNLHPFDKRDPGERLARIALANTYGKNVPFSGPVFKALAMDGGKARVTFSHTDGGLVARAVPETYKPNTNAPPTKPLVRTSPGSPLEGFAVCGDDGKWEWANASLDGDVVVVSAAAVPRPKAVRYDWSDCPWGNLYNGAGLPAAPFRTDDQPELSAKNHY